MSTTQWVLLWIAGTVSGAGYYRFVDGRTGFIWIVLMTIMAAWYVEMDRIVAEDLKVKPKIDPDCFVS